MADTDPQVDVGIPVFGHSPYLEEAIASVAGQTLTAWRLHLSQDGPALSSVAELVAARGDARISYSATERAVGAPANKNRLIDRGQAPYVALLDHDDVWEPDFLRRRVELLDAHPGCGFVCSPLMVLDAAGTAVERAPRLLADGVHASADAVAALLRSSGIPGGSVVARRSAYRAVGARFCSALPRTYDYEMWVRLALRFPVGYLGVWDVGWRRHGGNVSTTDLEGYDREYDELVARLATIVARERPELCSHPAMWRRKLGSLLLMTSLDALGEGRRRTAWRYLARAIVRDPRGAVRPRTIAVALRLALGRRGAALVAGARRIRRWRRSPAGTLPLAVALVAAAAVAAVVSPPARASAATATRVPAAIDPTGSSDVTAALERFVDSVPDGSTIVFPHGARYRLDGTLELRDRRGLTLEGAGATLFAGTRGNAYRAHVRLSDGGGWTIRDLTVEGAHPRGAAFDPARQWQHGFDLRGVDGATLRNVTVRDVWGDDIYVGLSTTSARWSQDVSIIDSQGLRSGRMAVAVTAGRRITVHGGVWSEPGLSTFDVEPNGAPGGAHGIVFEHATLGPGARDRALDVTGSGPISDVTLRDNVLTGRPLHVRVDQGRERPRNIVVRDNRSSVVFTGPAPAAMLFRNTDGVTVTGNRQSLRSRAALALVATENSTGVVVSGQHPYVKLHETRLAPVAIIAALAAATLLLGALLRRRRAASRAARASDPTSARGPARTPRR
jgi:glycosyltransferase involved in cell wall biosynthesis